MYKTELTFIVLQDSTPLAGLARAASLSRESSSSESLTLTTWALLLDCLDLDFALQVWARATAFVDMVQDFVWAEEGGFSLLVPAWVDLPEVLDVLSLVSAVPDLVAVLDTGAFFLLVPLLTEWDGQEDLVLTPDSG